MKRYVRVFTAIFLITTSMLIPQLFTTFAEDSDPYVSVDKTATAYEIICGQEILVNLTVTGVALGGPFDIILVIDRSGSMAIDDALEDAKAAAIAFVDNRTFTPDPATSDWVGVVSYSSASRGHPAATLDQGLTNDPDLLTWAIGNLTTNGRTNIMAGVHLAQGELADHGRAQAQDVIILLSDGVANQWTNFDTGTSYDQPDANSSHTTSTLKAIQEANWAKGNGTIVFTIGLRLADLGPGVTEIAIDTLQQMATSLDYFFDAAEPGYLEEIYGIITTYIGPAATDLTITDTVEDEFTIVMGSFNPPYTSLVGNTITWEFDVLGSENRSFTYKIRPIRGLNGWYPTNVEANLTYTDHEDNPAFLEFPIPEVYLYRVCESAITLIKTADPTLISPPQMVTYTYNVTNPGPYPLHGVNLTDDIYGKIAGPFDLAVGETRIFTHEAYPTQDVTNWGNATGWDPWNYPVTDLDDATVEVITECTVYFYTVPSDVGNITIVGGETYLNGGSDTWDYCTTLTAVANAPEGYVFDHWLVEGNLDVLEEIGNTIRFHIACGGNITAYFRPVITPEPRTIGFWKHQVYVYLYDKATAQVTEQELLSYLQQVSMLSNYQKFKDIYVGDNDDTLRNAFSILWIHRRHFATSTDWMKACAERQLLATWLNTVSGKLSMGTRLDSSIYGGLGTVGEAIAYCENILMDGNSTFHDYEEAKTICDNINNSKGIIG
ncbi:MAG: VWA domain-containing protein [Candidatus Bathyarchaeota archaeon]|nr:MAG: VWA domain-containing protein [Candidatus Bathyarchaeota archaeon]